MKAIRLYRNGAPDVLVYDDVPQPRPGPGQVLIRNEAAGVNFAEIVRRRGGFYPVPTSLPYILGGEFAGVVETLGDGVSGLKVGDKVFGVADAAASGCYAQYVVVPADVAFPLPEGIGYADATGLLVQGLTAYFLLRDGVRLTKGDSVLILAAAGGLGSLAVQLAAIMGAGQVIGAASTPEKRLLVKELGANTAIDYTRAGWSAEVLRATDGRGVDAALVNTGGDSFIESLASLAPFGRLSAYGNADSQTPVIDFAAQMGAGRLVANQTLGFFGLHYYQEHAADDLRSAVDQLTDHLRHDRLQLLHGQQFPLAQAAKAHQLIETRQTTGKVVLLPWAD